MNNSNSDLDIQSCNSDSFVSDIPSCDSDSDILSCDSDSFVSDDEISTTSTSSTCSRDIIKQSDLDLAIENERNSHDKVINNYYTKIQEANYKLQTCSEKEKPRIYGQLFEYVCAIIMNVKLFDDVEPLIKSYYLLPNKDRSPQSAGVDLMDSVNKVFYQCKYYKRTVLTHRHLGTFYRTMINFTHFDSKEFKKFKEFKYVILIGEDTKHHIDEIKDVLSIQVISEKMIKDVLNAAQAYVPTIPPNVTNLSNELYDYQAAIIKLMEQNDKYSFQLPCGSGKSHLIMKYASTHNERIAILVPTISIAQMYRERMNTPVNKFFTGQKCVEENNVSIVVYKSSAKLQKQYDTIIVDEAHHYLKNAHGIQNCKSKKLFLFSATLDEKECRKLTDDNYYVLSQIECINRRRILDFNVYVHCIGNIDKQDALVNTLQKYWEYQHVIIYCSTKDEINNIYTLLKKSNISATYVSSDLGQSQNQENIKAFSEGKYRVIINCEIINEGIDIKGCETCMFYSQSDSYTKIIQCIGRTQRVSENKLHGNVVLLSNKPEKDLSVFLNKINKQYVVDNKRNYCKYKVNLINDIECTDDSVNIDEIMYEYERYIYEDVYMTNKKLELCKEFFKAYQRLPTVKEEFKGWKIGFFINDIKHDHNKHLKQQVEEIFQKEIKVVKKIVNLSEEDKLNLCKEFFKAYQRLPKKSEKIKDFKIGGFIDRLKHCKNSQLKSQVEEIFQKEIKVVKKIVNLSDEDKLNLCKEFFKAYQRLPTQKETFKDFKIGIFISGIKQGFNCELKPQVEEIFQKEIKVVKKIVNLSDEDKLNLCKEFFKAYQRLPTQKETFKDFKIGIFISGIKQGFNCELKPQVEEIFQKEIKVVKKIVNLSEEDKLNLCKEFFKAYQKLPKSTDTFKDFKIGNFISGIKQGCNSHLKQQVEEIFHQEIKYNKKIVNLSEEDKLNLCKEFFKAYQRLPKQSEKFKDFKIGNFISGIKQGKNSQIKLQVEEIFHQEIKAVKKTV